MTRKTKECPACHRYITLNNYARHLRVCCANITKSCTHLPLEHDGLNCIFCNKLCKNKKSLTQHELRCAKNADRLKVEIKGFNDKGRRAWNKGLTKNIDLRIQKAAIKRSKTTRGRKGKPHTIQQKEVLRQHALKHQLGGFHMRRGIYYKGIKLDSSYEVIVAKNLDYSDIVWTRCSRFPYYIDGVLHYYIPDFYLPKYDVYLDPKNDYLIKNINPVLGYKDVDKIEAVMLENNIKIIILSKEQLYWEKIKEKIENV